MKHGGRSIETFKPHLNNRRPTYFFFSFLATVSEFSMGVQSVMSLYRPDTLHRSALTFGDNRLSPKST